MKLLNPGPVSLSGRVRQALTGPDLCHREPEFSELQGSIRAQLERVYEAPEHSSVVLTGSGTAAVEAMVGSLVPREALVMVNGVYGERMAAMLRAQGKTAHCCESGWAEPMDLARAERMLAELTVSHVLAVHHETTTGRLNEIPALARLCAARGVPLLLDAVSSFGGEELDFTGLEACAGTANKCLHGVPGISFVLARREALQRPSAATSIYLDLMRQHREQERGSSPFTQSVQVCYALAEALRELAEEGGWRRRQARYRELAELIAAALRARGVEPLLEAGASSAILSSWKLPEGHDYPRLHGFLKERGFIIYAGQGDFAGRIFRIAVMGDFQTEDARRLVAALEEHFGGC